MGLLDCSHLWQHLRKKCHIRHNDDYNEYKKYVNDITNTIIQNSDILNRIVEENNSEHSKKSKC